MGNKASTEKSLNQDSSDDVASLESVLSELCEDTEVKKAPLRAEEEKTAGSASQPHLKNKNIIIDLDENQEGEIDNLVLEEARSLLLAGNGSFYSGNFDTAYKAYKECIGTLMRPQRSADQVASRHILAYAQDMIQRGAELLRQNERLSPVAAGIQGLRTSLERRIERQPQQQQQGEEEEHREWECVAEADQSLLARVLFEQCWYETLGDSVNNCGGCKFVRSDMQCALAYYESALALRRIVDGSPSLSTAETLQNVASCYEALDKLSDAEETLKCALTMEKQLGMEHTAESTSTVNNLGVLYCHMKRYPSAEDLLATVVESRTKSLGSDHRLTMNALINLSIVRKRLQQAQHNETHEIKDAGGEGKIGEPSVPANTPKSSSLSSHSTPDDSPVPRTTSA